MAACKDFTEGAEQIVRGGESEVRLVVRVDGVELLDPFISCADISVKGRPVWGRRDYERHFPDVLGWDEVSDVATVATFRVGKAACAL